MAADTERTVGATESPTASVGGRRVVAPAVVLALALAGWQAAVWWWDVSPLILPSPVDVAGALADAWPLLLGDAAVTAATAALGLALGTAVGLLLAFAMVTSRVAAAVLRPYLVALRIAPLIAVAPLLFLWLGRGVPARAVLVATLTAFPVTIASTDGMRSVPDAYLDLARSVDAPAHRRFLRVRVPAAAPSVFAGVKLASVLSVVGAVVAEFITLDAGLGYRVFYTANTSLRTPLTFAALAVLAALGLCFYAVPAAVERRVSW